MKAPVQQVEIAFEPTLLARSEAALASYSSSSSPSSPSRTHQSKCRMNRVPNEVWVLRMLQWDCRATRGPQRLKPTLHCGTALHLKTVSPA